MLPDRDTAECERTRLQTKYGPNLLRADIRKDRPGRSGTSKTYTLRYTNSGSLATKAENKPAELDLFAGEPAGPAELRRSLVHSLEDFEVVLRRNDRASARRDPVAVPANARPEEGL